MAFDKQKVSVHDKLTLPYIINVILICFHRQSAVLPAEQVLAASEWQWDPELSRLMT